MATLRYRFNYRQDDLPPHPTNYLAVGIHTRKGDTERVQWLGTMELNQAKRLPGVRPVRLDVRAYSLEEGQLVTGWEDVPQDWYVQGALVREGVYGVTVKNRPRLVKKTA